MPTRALNAKHTRPLPPRKISAGNGAGVAGAAGKTSFRDAEAASNLCVQCGLCCDGSLFSEVELASDMEAADLEPHGLNVDDGDEDEPAVLNQPCGALCGSRCSIYAQRPECCRTFECKLLKDFKRGLVSRDAAAARIENLRGQLRAIGKLLHAVNASADLPLQERYYEA